MAEKIYVVKSGENLSVIARDVLGNIDRWKELAFINGLAHPYWIKPGQILQLPGDEGMVIEVKGKRPTKPNDAATAKKTSASLSPATIIVLIVVAAFLLSK